MAGWGLGVALLLKPSRVCARLYGESMSSEESDRRIENRPAFLADLPAIRRAAIGLRYHSTMFAQMLDGGSESVGHHVAVRSGEVVGWVAVNPPDEPPDQFLVPWERSMKVNVIAVHPQFRRHGIGRYLIATVAEFARREGADSLWGLAQQDDDFVAERLAFFAACGFAPIDHELGITDPPDYVGGSIDAVAAATSVCGYPRNSSLCASDDGLAELNKTCSALTDAGELEPTKQGRFGVGDEIIGVGKEGEPSG